MNNIGLTFEDSTDPYLYFAPFYLYTGGKPLLTFTCSNGCYWWPEGVGGAEDSPAARPVTSVAAIRTKVGAPTHLNSVDISAGNISQALITGDMSYEWHIDCDDPTAAAPVDNNTYIFTKPQSCKAALMTAIHRNYCYFTCPGPYGGVTYSRNTTVFDLTVLPANVTASPLPGPIRNLTKNRYDDHLTLNWQAPANAQDIGQMAYIIRDSDSNLIGVTTATQLTITDLPSNVPEPLLTVATSSENGTGQEINSDSVATTMQFTQSGKAPYLFSQSGRAAIEQTFDITQADIANSYNNGIYLPNAKVALTLPVQPHSADGLGEIQPRQEQAPLPPWLGITITAIPLSLAGMIGLYISPGFRISLINWLLRR